MVSKISPVFVFFVVWRTSALLQPFTFTPHRYNDKSFQITPCSNRLAGKRNVIDKNSPLYAIAEGDRDIVQETKSGTPMLCCSRRQALLFSTATTATLFGGFSTLASATIGLVGTEEHPIAILGASGRTGMEVTQILASSGLHAVTMTRTGRNPFQMIKLPPSSQALVEHFPDPVDVRDKDQLKAAFQKISPSAVVYAASASRIGGTAGEVDDVGAGLSAEVFAQESKKVGDSRRFVLISALAVDRPDSKSFKITNSLGRNYDGIMDAKRRGEEKVREALPGKYVIVRPGVLLSGPRSKNGPLDLEVNQGDFVGGGLTRADLASAVVGSLVSGVGGVTVEVYQKKTRTKLQPEFEEKSGKEVEGADSYEGLFEKLVADA